VANEKNERGGDSLSDRFKASDVKDPKDDAIWAGLEMLEGRPDRVTETYQDLCLDLDTIQVKQVNELVKLLVGKGRS
jgi:hypothetical protein